MKKNIINSFTAEGYLYGIRRLVKRVSGEKSKNPGTEYISGDVLIATDEEGLNVIPINFRYVNSKTKTGKENPTFKLLSKIIDICEDDSNELTYPRGKTKALKLGINNRAGASLNLNDYYSTQNNEAMSVPIIKGGFINEIKSFSSDEGPFNKFSVDALILGCKILEDETSNEESMVLKACVFDDYTKEIKPVDFKVRSAAGIKYFENKDIDSKHKMFTVLHGTVKNSTIIESKEEESAWGEATVTSRKTLREWLVLSSAKNEYEFGDEETAMTEDEFKAALQDREVLLAENKKRAEQNAEMQKEEQIEVKKEETFSF